MDKAKLKRIPDAPGVYMFKDKKGNILYIGKARSLSSRVRSYFTRPQSLKIQAMASKIADLDYMVTKSETEARLKEARLIKENLPVYNTAFRDDKSFPLICISNEDFPLIWITRKKSKMPKGLSFRCFGPYADAGLLRQALKSIRHIFGFRSCSRMPKKPCLYYRIGLCPAPCTRKVGIKKYKQNIQNIILFLQGRQKDLLDKLTLSMHRLSKQKKFEQAAEVRNQIQALSSLYQGGAPSSSTSAFYRESNELKQALGLDILPLHIEAFDVSNISGSSACASMVSFYEGNPDKSNYRRFRIKGVLGINDYQMLEEAVARRYSRLIEKRLPLPDLIIIDGGKGQLNVVKRKLKELGLGLAVISIAKQKEDIYIPGREAPLRLKSNAPEALRLIQRVRDEAHRFALSYHHILRRKKMIGK